jgi:hypothetical protein
MIPPSSGRAIIWLVARQGTFAPRVVCHDGCAAQHNSCCGQTVGNSSNLLDAIIVMLRGLLGGVVGGGGTRQCLAIGQLVMLRGTYRHG